MSEIPKMFNRTRVVWRKVVCGVSWYQSNFRFFLKVIFMVLEYVIFMEQVSVSWMDALSEPILQGKQAINDSSKST